MPSRQVQVAQAVADAVSGAAPGTFSQAVTVERVWISRKTPEELEAAHVAVSPVSAETERSSQADRIDSVVVGLLVRKQVPAGSEDAGCDALSALVQEIADFVWSASLEDFGVPESVDVDAFDPESIDQKGLFVATIAATYPIAVPVE